MRNRAHSSRLNHTSQRDNDVENDENQEDNCDVDSLDGRTISTPHSPSFIPRRKRIDKDREKNSLPIPRKLISEHLLLEQTFDELSISPRGHSSSSHHDNVLRMKTLSNDIGNAIQIKREVCECRPSLWHLFSFFLSQDSSCLLFTGLCLFFIE